MDLVGVAGIIATLFGVCIGALVTLKVTRDTAREAARTRFHDSRLDTYARYLSSCHRAMICLTTPGCPHPTDDINEVIKSFVYVELLASPPVGEAAWRVLELLTDANRAGLSGTPTSPPSLTLQHDFNTAFPILTAAIRGELES